MSFERTPFKSKKEVEFPFFDALTVFLNVPLREFNNLVAMFIFPRQKDYINFPYTRLLYLLLYP